MKKIPNSTIASQLMIAFQQWETVQELIHKGFPKIEQLQNIMNHLLLALKTFNDLGLPNSTFPPCYKLIDFLAHRTKKHSDIFNILKCFSYDQMQYKIL